MKRTVLFLLAALLIFGMSGCAQNQQSHKLSVVTTIFVSYDFARQIASEEADITMLLSPGEEVHTYEPSPRDLIRIQNCDLFICAGGESEAWVDRILDSLPSPIRVIRMMDLVEAVEEEAVGAEAAHDHEHDHENENEEPELDEHVWTSPKNAQIILEAISEALCALEPDCAPKFRANTERYRASIAAIDAQFEELFANGGEIVVADRFPFRYLADAYNITYYAAYPGCSNDAEPSSATIRYLIDLIRENRIGTVFTIEFSNGKLADILCEETGCRRTELHSCHNVSRDDFDAGVSYVDLMTRNLQHIKEAIS